MRRPGPDRSPRDRRPLPHGREEHRRVEVFAAADRLDPDWRPSIACVARVTRRTWCRDTRTGLWRQRREVAYYASQVPLDARELVPRPSVATGASRTATTTCATARCGEDASRIRRKPGIFARLRSFALNILRAHGVTNVSEALYTNALSLDHLLDYGLPKS